MPNNFTQPIVLLNLLRPLNCSVCAGKCSARKCIEGRVVQCSLVQVNSEVKGPLHLLYHLLYPLSLCLGLGVAPHVCPPVGGGDVQDGNTLESLQVKSAEKAHKLDIFSEKHSKIPHTSIIRPSCMCSIQEYRHYTIRACQFLSKTSKHFG